jgi:hypothetical protein
MLKTMLPRPAATADSLPQQSPPLCDSRSSFEQDDVPTSSACIADASPTASHHVETVSTCLYSFSAVPLPAPPTFLSACIFFVMHSFTGTSTPAPVHPVYHDALVRDLLHVRGALTQCSSTAGVHLFCISLQTFLACVGHPLPALIPPPLLIQCDGFFLLPLNCALSQPRPPFRCQLAPVQSSHSAAQGASIPPSAVRNPMRATRLLFTRFSAE